MIGFSFPRKFSPQNGHFLPIRKSFLPRKFLAIRVFNSPMIIFNIIQLIMVINTTTHNYVKHACQSSIFARASHPFLKTIMGQLSSKCKYYKIMPVHY